MLPSTVASLARTVLKPSVLQPRGTRRQRQLVLTDGMDGMDGMVGPFSFLLPISCKLLDNYS